MRYLSLLSAPLLATCSATGVFARSENVISPKCDVATVSTAGAENLAQLVVDAECYTHRMVSAANSQAYDLPRCARSRQRLFRRVALPRHPHQPPRAPFPRSHGARSRLLERAKSPANTTPRRGAFRFTCGGDGPLTRDDPVVYPGEPGRAHLHQVWGNRTFDAFLTTERLLASPSTNCNDTPFSGNRSSYWQPALMHDSGDAIRPDLVSVYYKGYRRGAPHCTPGDPLYVGECINIPAGIRFVFGWDQYRPTDKVVGARWTCTGTSRGFKDLEAAFAAGCKPGATLTANT